MNAYQLKLRLYRIAKSGFKSARADNPFWTTREASTAFVVAFAIVKTH